jgi:hypothetical protein
MGSGVAPAHLVLVGMLVITLLLGLWPGSPLASPLGLIAARADESSDLSAAPDLGRRAGAGTVVYCPLVLHNWFPKPPVIASFSASPGTINPGETTTLQWSIHGPVNRVTLEPGAGTVTVLNSYMFTPVETTTYTLTAYSSYGSSKAQVTVNVRRPPEITSFTATPETMQVGQSATLAWSVSGDVDSLKIEPGVGDVAGQSSVVVYPTQATLYKLTATNAVGSSTAEVMVAIEGPPEITSFSAHPAVIQYGESTELRWTVSNPIGTLTLEPGVGDVTGQTSALVSPLHTTVYTLTASSVNGNDTAQVTVDVDVSMLPHELLVYDWNRPVTTSQSGFPRTPPREAANGDWTAPVNFADGVLYFRVEIPRRCSFSSVSGSTTRRWRTVGASGR